MCAIICYSRSKKNTFTKKRAFLFFTHSLSTAQGSACTGGHSRRIKLGPGHDQSRLLTHTHEMHVLRTKVESILAMGAMEIVSAAHGESGFYRCYFLIPKKDGALRPILEDEVTTPS